jgi:hypothetical protein
MSRGTKGFGVAAPAAAAAIGARGLVERGLERGLPHGVEHGIEHGLEGDAARGTIEQLDAGANNADGGSRHFSREQIGASDTETFIKRNFTANVRVHTKDPTETVITLFSQAESDILIEFGY